MATDLANNIQTARIVGGYRFVRGTNAPNINRGRQYQYCRDLTLTIGWNTTT